MLESRCAAPYHRPGCHVHRHLWVDVQTTSGFHVYLVGCRIHRCLHVCLQWEGKPQCPLLRGLVTNRTFYTRRSGKGLVETFEHLLAESTLTSIQLATHRYGVLQTLAGWETPLVLCSQVERSPFQRKLEEWIQGVQMISIPSPIQAPFLELMNQFHQKFLEYEQEQSTYQTLSSMVELP